MLYPYRWNEENSFRRAAAALFRNVGTSEHFASQIDKRVVAIALSLQYGANLPKRSGFLDCEDGESFDLYAFEILSEHEVSHDAIATLKNCVSEARWFVDAEKPFDRDVVPAVERALDRLRQKGYFCAQDWKCCCTCGWDEISWEDAEKAVWYHRQHRDDAIVGGDLYFIWTGDATLIRAAFEAEGFATDHNGSQQKCIVVKTLSIVEAGAIGAVPNRLGSDWLKRLSLRRSPRW
jgi:hypothetical protein